MVTYIIFSSTYASEENITGPDHKRSYLTVIPITKIIFNFQLQCVEQSLNLSGKKEKRSTMFSAVNITTNTNGANSPRVIDSISKTTDTNNV